MSESTIVMVSRPVWKRHEAARNPAAHCLTRANWLARRSTSLAIPNLYMSSGVGTVGITPGKIAPMKLPELPDQSIGRYALSPS